MTKIINLKSILIAVAMLFAVTAFVYEVLPQLSGSMPVAEACCGGGDGDGDGGYLQGNYYSQGYYESYYESSYGVPASCDSFTGSPTSVPFGGGNVTLAWETTNATSVSINNGVGAVADDGSTSVFVDQNTTFTLTAKGTGGDDTCKVTITVEPEEVASCDYFAATPATVPYGGGNVTLAWQTTNANSVSIDNGVGAVADDGNTTVFVGQTTTFTLTAVGTDGNDTCTAKVTVQPESSASCDLFTVAPGSLPFGGGNVTLTWETTNANSVSINNGIGAVADDGNTSVFVDKTTTFTLTAVGTDGNAICSDTVTVGPDNSVASCDSFSVSPSRFTNGTGGTVTLTWNTTNADSVSIDQGIGTVADDGNTTYNVTGDTTFTLTVVGANNNDTCTASVVVEDDSDISCDSFTANDTSVVKNTNVTLSWETTGVTSVDIDQGVGNNLPADGEIDVEVKSDTTYTLTLSNGQVTRTCKVTIEADDGGGGGGGGGSRTPRCDLDISDDKVKAGDEITLSWDTTYAREITIETGDGDEIFESDDDDYMDGEIDIVVYEDTEFVLIAERGSRDRKCRVEVEVEDDVKVFEKRDQPLVISLTEVPYTGFEAGPVLTTIFYSLLVLWALFLAYWLVIRKDSVLGFRLQTVNDTEADTAALELKKKVQMLAARHSHRPWNE